MVQPRILGVNPRDTDGHAVFIGRFVWFVTLTAVNVTIDWGALGAVFLVSFGAAVGLIVLFSLGVSALAAPVTQRSSAPDEAADKPVSRAALSPVALLYFGACALIVAYGLYLIIVK